ncbi:MAG: hypothetical protein WC749_02570 [Dehalococcoidia bacterium]
MPKKFELGQKVIVNARVLPHPSCEDEDTIRNVRRWERHEIPWVCGIIVGVRTVKEGYADYIKGHSLSYSLEPPEEYYAFIPTKHIKVYLVALNMKTFIRVLPEDIEVQP